MKHKGDIIRCPGSQPTYEELKPVKPLHDGKFEVGSQPTYEELKLIILLLTSCGYLEFLAYL